VSLQQPVSRGTAGVGFTAHHVRVTAVDLAARVAHVTEVTTGALLPPVALVPIRVKMPEVGEVWIIDRAYGPWSFAALIDAPGLFDG
jgi:hypothetical protein